MSTNTHARAPSPFWLTQQPTITRAMQFKPLVSQLVPQVAVAILALLMAQHAAGQVPGDLPTNSAMPFFGLRCQQPIAIHATGGPNGFTVLPCVENLWLITAQGARYSLANSTDCPGQFGAEDVSFNPMNGLVYAMCGFRGLITINITNPVLPKITLVFGLENCHSPSSLAISSKSGSVLFGCRPALNRPFDANAWGVGMISPAGNITVLTKLGQGDAFALVDSTFPVADTVYGAGIDGNRFFRIIGSTVTTVNSLDYGCQNPTGVATDNSGAVVYTCTNDLLMLVTSFAPFSAVQFGTTTTPKCGTPSDIVRVEATSEYAMSCLHNGAYKFRLNTTHMYDIKQFVTQAQCPFCYRLSVLENSTVIHAACSGLAEGGAVSTPTASALLRLQCGQSLQEPQSGMLMSPCGPSGVIATRFMRNAVSLPNSTVSIPGDKCNALALAFGFQPNVLYAVCTAGVLVASVAETAATTRPLNMSLPCPQPGAHIAVARFPDGDVVYVICATQVIATRLGVSYILKPSTSPNCSTPSGLTLGSNSTWASTSLLVSCFDGGAEHITGPANAPVTRYVIPRDEGLEARPAVRFASLGVVLVPFARTYNATVQNRIVAISEQTEAITQVASSVQCPNPTGIAIMGNLIIATCNNAVVVITNWTPAAPGNAVFTTLISSPECNSPMYPTVIVINGSSVPVVWCANQGVVAVDMTCAHVPGTVVQNGYCSPCVAGSFRTWNDTFYGGVTCTPCADGSVAPGVGAPACIPCEAGTHGISKLECYECSPGRFTNGTGLTTCYSCDAGSSASASAQSTCDACRPGSSSARGATSCLVCPAGSFSNSSNARQCNNCPSGQFNNVTNSTSCEKCRPGHFQDQEGTTICRPCPNGLHVMTSGATACESCSSGRFANVSAMLNCSVCPKGTYASGVGNDRCIACPHGRAAESEQQSDCIPCSTGFYANTTGSVRCQACEPGSSSQGLGNRMCTQCAPGSAATGEGAAICAPCNAGFATNTTGSRNCSPCIQGKYAPERGTVQCIDCVGGRFALGDGNEQCKICRVGTYASIAQSSSCRACEPGTYVDQNGSSVCLACPTGRYQNLGGQSVCFHCPEQHFIRDNEQNRSKCERCPFPSYANRNGSFFCDYCSPGFYSVWLHNGTAFNGCQRCPAGITCDPFLGTIESSSGFWMSTDSQGLVKAFICPPNYCQGPQCAKNRKPIQLNPLCGECLDGFYEWQGECVLCTEGASSGWIVLFFACSLIFVIVFHYLAQESSAELGITLFFIQMASILTTSALGQSIPFLAWFNLDLLQSPGGTCLAPLSAAVKLSSPLWIALIVFGEWLLFATGNNVYYRLRGRSTDALIVPFGKSFLALILFTFNSIVQGALRVFRCIDVHVEDEVRSVVKAYPAVDCHSGAYPAMFASSIAVCLLYLLFVPLVLAWRVRSHQPGGQNAVQTTEYQILAVIRQPYDEKLGSGGLWEILKLMMRAVVLTCLVFTDDVVQKLCAASILIGVYTVFFIKKRPYRLETCLHAEELACLFLLLVALVLMATGPTYDAADKVGITLLTIVPSCILLCWLVTTKWKTVIVPTCESYLEHHRGIESGRCGCHCLLGPVATLIIYLDNARKRRFSDLHNAAAHTVAESKSAQSSEVELPIMESDSAVNF